MQQPNSPSAERGITGCFSTAVARHPCSQKTSVKHPAFSSQVRGKVPRQDTAQSPLPPHSGPPWHRRDTSTIQVRMELPTSVAPGSCLCSQKEGCSCFLLGISISILVLKLVCETASHSLGKHLLFPSWVSLAISCYNPSAVPCPVFPSREGLWLC